VFWRQQRPGPMLKCDVGGKVFLRLAQNCVLSLSLVRNQILPLVLVANYVVAFNPSRGKHLTRVEHSKAISLLKLVAIVSQAPVNRARGAHKRVFTRVAFRNLERPITGFI